MLNKHGRRELWNGIRNDGDAIGMKVQGLENIDLPEIDIEAIREAVINNPCHCIFNNSLLR